MFLQQFPGGLYSVHFPHWQHFPAQTGFIQHWNYICTTYKDKVWFDALWHRPSAFSSLLFASQNFQSGFNLKWISWKIFIILGMNTSLPEHLCVINYICTFFSFIRIHDDGARKWEPCWLIWFFCKHLWPSTLFLRVWLKAVKRFSLFVCVVWTF